MASPTPKGPLFSVDLDDREDVALVRAIGELDLAAILLFGAILAQAAAAPVRVVLDLSAVTFCTSGILGCSRWSVRALVT